MRAVLIAITLSLAACDGTEPEPATPPVMEELGELRPACLAWCREAGTTKSYQCQHREGACESPGPDPALCSPAGNAMTRNTFPPCPRAN